MRTRRLEAGSAAKGGLSEGCVMCARGSKMVLFVTGICGTGCFYCPVSGKRKGNDAMYANEMRISGTEDAAAEAETMSAEGTGITGGDPLRNMDRTLKMIRALKERFGAEHHIHLYTSSIEPDKIRELAGAGLDEIRLHPSPDSWASLPKDRILEIASIKGLKVGFEVPALPDHREQLTKLVRDSPSLGIDFINLNELEFSEGNWDMMSRYELKDDTSSAVLGSVDLAHAMIKISKVPIHFCSSAFKDSVQLRRRLIRRAERIASPYDIVTEDGTILRGILYADDPDEAARVLAEYGVPEDLMRTDRKHGRIETASWILEELSGELPYECCITEQYPTADMLEVERMPLRGMNEK